MKLTNKEKEEIFYNSLCNAEGMGYMNGYGVEMSYEPEQYAAAKQALKEASKDICYEDILMEILKSGGSLTHRYILKAIAENLLREIELGNIIIRGIR